MAKSAFSQFPRPFYIINGIELLERGAFYTMNYVLATYMSFSIGLSAPQVGAIASILFALLYIIPLLGAPFAEKYGYKVGLFASFAFLTAGYISLLAANDFSSMLLSVGLIGVGAGIFKPIAAAVVAQTSSDEQRNFAFIIYYGAINVGATVFPLGVAITDLFVANSLHLLAFTVAAILAALNFVLVATAWKNLRAPQKDKSIIQALATLGDIFRYPKLITLFVIYSGFWFLYAMSLSFLAVYMIEFQRMPSWFNELFLGTINPAVIVIVAPFLGRLTRPFASLQLMIVGIALYVVGFVIVGFTTTNPASPAAGIAFFLTGVAIFSIGEVLTHPSFLAYVSKIAPPDKVSVFLGYGFLPIAFGLFFGASTGGILYGRFAQDGNSPALFWAIMSAVALITVAALLIYNRVITPKARVIAPGPGEPKRKRGFGAYGTFGLAALALLMVPALIVAAGTLPGSQSVTAASTEPLAAANLETVELPDITGNAREGETTSHPMSLPASTTGSVTLTLTWTDEPTGTPGATNAPDTFKIHLMFPDGTMVESSEASSGTLEFIVPNMTPGDYTLDVELVRAGDVSVMNTPLGPAPVGGSADTGNAFTLAIAYQVNR